MYFPREAWHAVVVLVIALAVVVTAWSLRFGRGPAWQSASGASQKEPASGSALPAPRDIRAVAEGEVVVTEDQVIVRNTHLMDGLLRVSLRPDGPASHTGHGLVLVVDVGESLDPAALAAALEARKRGVFTALWLAGGALCPDDVRAALDAGAVPWATPRLQDAWSQATAAAPWSTVTVADGSDGGKARRVLTTLASRGGTQVYVQPDGGHSKNDDWWAALNLDPPPCLTQGACLGWTTTRFGPKSLKTSATLQAATTWTALQVARALDLRSDLRTGSLSFPAAALLVGLPLDCRRAGLA